MGEVLDLGSKLQRWSVAFDNGKVSVRVSNHGGLMVRTSPNYLGSLKLVEAMQLLQGVLREYIKHGFNKDIEPSSPEPPPKRHA
jgi:hypothetical protein